MRDAERGEAANAVETLRRLLADRRWTWRDVWRATRDLEGAEIPDVLPLLDELPRSDERDHLHHSLFERWARVAPAAALERAQSLPSGNARELALGGVLSGWAQQDPAAAAEWVAGRVGPRPSQYGVWSVAATWAARDPDAALTWVRALPPGESRDRAMSAAISQITERDPARAIDLAVAQGGQAADYLVSFAAGRLARGDLALALVKINALPASVDRPQIFRSVVTALAEDDPKLAGEFALTLPAGSLQGEALAALGRSWGERDPRAAVAWIESAVTVGSAREAAWTAAIGAAVQDSPVVAAKLVDAVGGAVRRDLVLQVAGAWAQTDAIAASAWAKGLADANQRGDALRATVREWARQDPAGACEFVLSEVSAGDRSRPLRSAAATWAESAPDAAFARFAQLGGSPEQSGFALGLVDRFAQSDPARAFAVVAALSADVKRDEVARTLAAQLGQFDPARAVGWLGTLDDAPLRTAAAKGLASTWAQREPAAAAQWVATLPDGGLRDGVVDSFLASQAAPKRAQLATALVQGSADPTRRIAATEDVARRWLRIDRAAAEAWLATTELSAERKARLLSPPPGS